MLIIKRAIYFSILLFLCFYIAFYVSTMLFYFNIVSIFVIVLLLDEPLFVALLVTDVEQVPTHDVQPVQCE